MIIKLIASLMQLVGVVAVTLAAFLLATWLGLFVAGVTLVLVGYLLEKDYRARSSA